MPSSINLALTPSVNYWREVLAPAPLIEPATLVEPRALVKPHALIEPSFLIDPAPLIQPGGALPPASWVCADFNAVKQPRSENEAAQARMMCCPFGALGWWRH